MRTARERGWAAEVVKVEMTGARELVRLDQVLRVQARDSAAIRRRLKWRESGRGLTWNSKRNGRC
jgi:hypothetical protein